MPLTEQIYQDNSARPHLFLSYHLIKNPCWTTPDRSLPDQQNRTLLEQNELFLIDWFHHNL